MTYQILILSSQKKPYLIRCVSARITPLSTPALWKLMMLFWAFPMLHLQMTPSCKIPKELNYIIQNAKKIQKPNQDIVHLTEGWTSCDAGFLFFNLSVAYLYFVMYKWVYLRYCYSSGIFFSLDYFVQWQGSWVIHFETRYIYIQHLNTL